MLSEPKFNDRQKEKHLYPVCSVLQSKKSKTKKYQLERTLRGKISQRYEMGKSYRGAEGVNTSVDGEQTMLLMH